MASHAPNLHGSYLEWCDASSSSSSMPVPSRRRPSRYQYSAGRGLPDARHISFRRSPSGSVRSPSNGCMSGILRSASSHTITTSQLFSFCIQASGQTCLLGQHSRPTLGAMQGKWTPPKIRAKLTINTLMKPQNATKTNQTFSQTYIAR